jgi:AcrR family transcriptional regulator
MTGRVAQPAEDHAARTAPTRLAAVAAPRTSVARLSVDDWIEAGYAILGEEGVEKLKIDNLCGRLGATKGSFYWHFTDIASYRDALVEAWAQLREADHHRLEELDDVEPRERLLLMMNLVVSPRYWALARAMREWARTDSAAAEGVRAADRCMVEAVRDAFLDYGLADDEANERANMMYATGIGALHLLGSTPVGWTGARRDWFIDFMLRP